MSCLEFLPRENTAELSQRPITVYRLDFSAKIKTTTGYKNVIIEIQKAKFAADIMRFRRYLGEQYQKKENSYIDEKDGKKKAMPILSIYFLGYALERIMSPLIKVQRYYYDAITGEEIQEKDDFIESLTHDSFVIQIPYLREKYKSDVEKLLSILRVI